ncbi:multidrug ABC transporter ATP-binding protein [Actinomadura cremea]|nr:multidrug ABC transporter ATP-binding protein [Actinomadura cremea]
MDTEKASPAGGGTVVEVADLRKSRNGRTVVDGVSFTVEDGEIFGILGPEGAGKTTIVECVEGLRAPDGGRVRVAGLDPVADHVAVTRILGAQFQQGELQPKMTVRETLELHSALYPSPLDWRPLAERLDLTAGLATRFGKLTGLQKQRLFIALALIGTPRVVVLDELTAGLDQRARREIWELIEDIRANGVTVLLVTPSMEEVQRLCDRVAVIDGGRVTTLGTPGGLIDRAEATTVISFTPSAPLDEKELGTLPALASIEYRDGRIMLGGTDETLNAVISLLARHHITARQLRVTDMTVDDVLVDLTTPDGDAPAIGRGAVRGDVRRDARWPDR